MGFFGKADEKGKTQLPEVKTETQRLTTKSDPRKLAAKTTGPVRTLTIGLAMSEKLASLGKERLEDGLRNAFPKGTKVTAVDLDASAEVRRAAARSEGSGETTRFFEVVLAAGDVQEAIDVVREKGILDGQIELSLDRCLVMLKATGRIAGLSGAVEAVEKFSFRYDIRCESQEVLVQYPPVEVHARWLADEDYRAAYQRWRTQRCEDTGAKPRPWHAGWAAASSDELGPPWIRLRSKDGRPDEHALEFDERVLLRFAFQGAEIKIMRFNLKLLSNKLTNEFSVYRSLPLTLESLPKDVQDRMNREPDRFKAIREPGKFGQGFDLVRQAYEEAGGDYFQVEGAVSAPAPGKSGSQPVSSPSEPPSSERSSSFDTPVPPEPADDPYAEEKKKPIPAPTPVTKPVPPLSANGDARTKLPVVTPVPASQPTKPATTSTLRGGLRASDVAPAKKPDGATKGENG